jgi:hypothetical protein
VQASNHVAAQAFSGVHLRRSVASPMLRAAILAPVKIVMTKIPVHARLDQFTAARAGDIAGLDQWPPLCTQVLMVCTVTPFRGARLGSPVPKAALLATAAAMACQRPCRAPSAAADAGLVEGHVLSLSGS